MKGLILHRLSDSNYHKRKELLNYLYQSGIDTTDRAMRKEIESMVVDDGYFIESSAKGYRLSTEETDYIKAVTYLRKKGISLMSRASALQKNYEKRFNKQLILEL